VHVDDQMLRSDAPQDVSNYLSDAMSALGQSTPHDEPSAARSTA
jgi:hypothetical protein